MKIRKSVVIVQKCKMGGYEHHCLAITWSAPIHSKISSTKPLKRGNGWFFVADWHWIQNGKSISSRSDELDARGLPNWGWKTASRQWLENTRLACPGQYFFTTKKPSFCQSRVKSQKLPLPLKHNIFKLNCLTTLVMVYSFWDSRCVKHPWKHRAT